MNILYNITITTLLLVILLYLKWIVVILFLPFQFLYSFGSKYIKNSTVAFFFKLFYWGIQKISRGGIERFCIYTMSLFPSCRIRRLYYILIGVNIGKNVVFHFKTEIRKPLNLYIGESSIIGDNAVLDARTGLFIGKNVNISSNVSIWSLQHNHRSPYFDCNFPNRNLKVKIEDRVWLGCNVIVLPGVNIGEGAVVCAGSVVTKDVTPYSVVAGIPAKQVSIRPNNLQYEFHGKSCWFY